ncbi:MAG: LamG domain-containing protein, partial [Candidatus Diapherotrites archaeon]|nr:LamG domain-containing protein [Candidatus Diapherotrites archaeon]
AAWIKLASYKTGSYNMLFGDEVGDYFGLRSNGTQWRAGYTNGSGVAVYGDLTGSLISLDSWHHVAFAYTVSGNTVNIKYYLDGVLQSGQINGSAGFTPKALLRIANYSQSTGAPLNGLVDDVRVYDSALSQQEIQAMMAGDTPPPTCLDLTSDSKVDLFDLVFVSLRLGNPAGDAADVLGNDGVNIQDLQKIAGHFGQDC